MRRTFTLALLAVIAMALLAVSSPTPSSAGPITTGTPPLTNTPSPSPIPTNTPRPTNTPTNTPTSTPTDTPTPTLTFTPSATFTPSNTPTDTATPTATFTPSDTPTPTATFTPSNTPTATFTPSDTPTPTATPIGPFTYPEGINPLMGVPYPSVEAMQRRPIIVKISNWPPVVRPQSGLSYADLVFEYEVEGGVTRFAAVFRNQSVTHVGPIRSGRLFDLELIVALDALFAYSGSSEPIRQIILDAPWRWRVMTPHFGDNCPPFCRFPREGLAFEHTLYLDLDQAWALATSRNVNTGYVVRGLAFSEIPPGGGAPAQQLFVNWWGETDATWQYNPTDGRYYRWNSGVPHVDALNGQQIAADNVVVLAMPHEPRLDLFEPEAHDNSLEIQFWDQGLAYVLRDGQIYYGYWRRPSREQSGFQLIWGDNTPIMLRPGVTWYEVVREGFPGVYVSAQPGDMHATETVAAPRFWTATPTPGPSPTAVP